MINNSVNGLIESFKMMYFMNIKDMSIFQNILSIIIITLFSALIYNENLNNNVDKYVQKVIEYFTNKKCKTIILEGKSSYYVTNYSSKTDNIFSDRFQAFWDYISKHNFDNNSINTIKEYPESHWSEGDYISEKRDNDECLEIMKSKNQFIVNQTTPFLVKPNIYCKVYTTKSINDDKKKVEVENIKIEIYSYYYSHNYLSNFLDNINIEYKKSINKARNNKKFIYTLTSNKSSGDNEYSRHNNRNITSIWNECEFKSSRTFNNLFFENKKMLLNKLNFFINNKDWYDYEGHPWTFGIGLHGPPGTGKTSIIKSIANKLNRHIIVIPLSKIKTQSQFNEYFFEEYYSNKNYKKIDFSQKIIVFEDIDCMSEIVKKRKIVSDNESDDGNVDNLKDIKDNDIDKKLNIQNKLLNKIAKKVDDEHNDTSFINLVKDNSDDITLSYILNIIDGIRETPGRIMIITSNNYDILDPALVRPGRIDLTLKMRNTTIDIIREMYSHYYKDILPENIITCLKDNVLSPAKIVNLRLQNTEKEDFIKALINEFKNN
jgi:ATP-dependent Zn protease